MKRILTDSRIVQARKFVVVKVLPFMGHGRLHTAVKRIWLRARGKGTERGGSENALRGEAATGVKDTLHDLKVKGMRLQRIRFMLGWLSEFKSSELL